MARNVEIKAKISPDDQRRIVELASKTGSGPQTLIQTDTFFNTADGRLKLREFADGTAELISYSRSDFAEPRICNYLRFEVEEPTKMKRMLELSTGIQCIVEKHRDVYFIDQARIHLDEVKDLGLFLEIEVVLRSDQIEEVGNDIMESLLEQFDIKPASFLAVSYADLILEYKTANNTILGSSTEDEVQDSADGKTEPDGTLTEEADSKENDMDE